MENLENKAVSNWSRNNFCLFYTVRCRYQHYSGWMMFKSTTTATPSGEFFDYRSADYKQPFHIRMDYKFSNGLPSSTCTQTKRDTEVFTRWTELLSIACEYNLAYAVCWKKVSCTLHIHLHILYLQRNKIRSYQFHTQLWYVLWASVHWTQGAIEHII